MAYRNTLPAACGDRGDDLMMAVVRKLVSAETDSEPVEDIFLEAQQISAQAEQLLVNADWERPAPKPETLVAAPSSGREEPVVELVPCDGHHGMPQAQLTLFSWAKFLADHPELQKPRGRNP